jgi:hypothetical protein
MNCNVLLYCSIMYWYSHMRATPWVWENDHVTHLVFTTRIRIQFKYEFKYVVVYTHERQIYDGLAVSTTVHMIWSPSAGALQSQTTTATRDTYVRELPWFNGLHAPGTRSHETKPSAASPG